MDLIKVRIITCFVVVITFIMSPGCTHKGIGTFGYVSLSPEDDCRNLLRLRQYLKEHYPHLCINNTVRSPSQNEKDIMEADHNIYYRFLSLLSGKPTPYNLETNHYTVKNQKWVELPENIQLAEWYERHQEYVNCEMFNEYYNIEKGIIYGPHQKVSDIDEYLSASEEFYDSLFREKEEFEKKYSHFLTEDSIRNISLKKNCE